jgi:ABC-type transport system involved in multi-copper enzyme maturation permease subunit
MKLLKAILMQLGIVFIGLVGLSLFFGIWFFIMDTFIEPVVEWLNMGHGLGAGLFIIFVGGFIALLVSAFIESIVNRYKKLKRE